MRFEPQTGDQYRVDIGKMLNALHPLYDAAKGTAEQDQYLDLLENARRQLTAVYDQIVPGEMSPPSYVESQFEAAQMAWETAIAAPKNLGFTNEKSFGQNVKQSVDKFTAGLKSVAESGEGISKYFKTLVIGGLAIGALLTIVYFAGKK